MSLQVRVGTVVYFNRSEHHGFIECKPQEGETHLKTPTVFFEDFGTRFTVRQNRGGKTPTFVGACQGQIADDIKERQVVVEFDNRPTRSGLEATRWGFLDPEAAGRPSKEYGEDIIHKRNRGRRQSRRERFRNRRPAAALR